MSLLNSPAESGYHRSRFTKLTWPQMTRDDSEWVNGLFAASAADRTPARSESYGLRSVCACFARSRGIMALRVSPVGYRVAEGEAVCNGDRQGSFQQRRAFRRYCGAFVLGSPQPLSRILFQETEKGRPDLPDLPNVRFSFSSCRFGFLGAWSSTHSIGVDLQRSNEELGGGRTRATVLFGS